MVKSWVSILLPDDEYKERKILYFLAEGSIILLVFLLISFGLHVVNPHWNFGIKVVTGSGIAIFACYVMFRYTFSGIEYTDIGTEKEYTKEKGLITFKSITFVVIFFVFISLFNGLPNSGEQWFEIIGLLASVGIAMFLINYISLKRSYKKNKDLVDDE